MSQINTAERVLSTPVALETAQEHACLVALTARSMALAGFSLWEIMQVVIGPGQVADFEDRVAVMRQVLSQLPAPMRANLALIGYLATIGYSRRHSPEEALHAPVIAFIETLAEPVGTPLDA